MNTGEFFRPDPNDDLAKRIAYLINGYNLRKLTSSEHAELDEWVNASIKNQQLFEELTDPANLKKWLNVMETIDKEEALNRVKRQIGLSRETVSHPDRKLNRYWLVAAVFIAIAFILIYKIEHPDKVKQDTVHVNQDLAPGRKQAMLITGNHTAILLDTLHSGFLSLNGSRFVKDSSGLKYEMAMVSAGPETFNELIIPPGGEFQIQLSDGTKVWLNAGTYLKYPEQFKDSIRHVYLSGEAYFEVSKDAAHPFIVTAAKNDIRVLGTHFGINAYADNSQTTVILSEGSVKINGSVILKPGEQGVVGAYENIKTEPADVEAAFSWKNGQFFFRMTPIEEVMRQVSHWYNARIVYKDNISEHFNANIPRNVPVSRLLHLLESTGQVHFKIQDSTITVLR